MVFRDRQDSEPRPGERDWWGAVTEDEDVCGRQERQRSKE